MNRQEAQELFATARNFNKGKPVALNTRLVKHYWASGEVLSLVLHQTPVVMFLDTTIRLNTAGWKTRTTKDRMNMVLYSYGYALFQKKNKWYVLCKVTDQVLDYYDGMQIAYQRN